MASAPAEQRARQDDEPLEPGQVLQDRYEVLGRLGQGAQATTLLALDRQTASEVVLKIVTLRSAGTWKAIELWERECQVLRQLDHPAIPRYVDAFQFRDEAGDHLFVLVQARVPGQDLARARREGRRFTEDQLVDLTRQALEVLGYLHGFQPPIVHRDLKPSNLILRPDGQLAVVDFGAVLAELPSGPAGGSTVVGTHGYMPAEQLMGRATPASDLFALGATLIHLASGHDPGDLPVERMRLQFEEVTALSAPFEKWLGRMTAPVPEDRFASAQAARQALDSALLSGKVPAQPLAPALRPPPVRRRWLRGLGLVLLAAVVLILVTQPRWFRRWKYRMEAQVDLWKYGSFPGSTVPVTFQAILDRGLRFQTVESVVTKDLQGRARLNVRGDLINQTGSALGNVPIVAELLDAKNRVLKTHHLLLLSDLFNPPLRSGEALRLEWSDRLTGNVAQVRLRSEGADRVVDPGPPVGKPVRWTALKPLPPGVALELKLRHTLRRKGGTLDHAVDLWNRGKATVRNLRFEITCFAGGKPTGHVERDVLSPTLLTLRPGERRAFWAWCRHGGSDPTLELTNVEVANPAIR